MGSTMKSKRRGRLLHLYDTERALDLLSQDLLDMIENTHDAITVADGESRILLVNPAFEKIMGLKNTEAIGNKISELVKNGASDTAASIKIMQSGRPETVFIRTAAGRQVVSSGVPVYDKSKKIRRIFCNLRDVTGLKQIGVGPSPFAVFGHPSDTKSLARQSKKEKILIAKSTKMQQITAFARRLGKVDSSVLILGESGVGKNLIARHIHNHSPRLNTGQFVKVSCAAIPEQLLESELFGYAPGAFTGASNKGKKGYFEIAHKGTLFLDEIGELPLWLQVKLLSAIQDRTFTRVGGTKSVACDIRLIAATNRDLEEMVSTGAFRKDLYYRLNVVPIRIPPLRERKKDIDSLLDHFIECLNARYDLEVSFTTKATKALLVYAWPGNVRELENLVERLAVTTEAPVIDLAQLPLRYQPHNPLSNQVPAAFNCLKTAVKHFELNRIKQTLAQTNSYEEAAASLGISLSTLARRIRK